MGRVKYLILALICAAMLFPVWLMVVNSFTDALAFLRMPPRIIPRAFTVQNYQRAFSMPWIWRWVANTLVLFTIVVVSGVLINGAAGYVFAFAKFKGKNILFWSMMSPIFVTGFSILISRFIVVGKLGLNEMGAVIPMSVFWPMAIYLFKNYFRSIPTSIMESARMDGASEWTILRRIVLPVSKPVVGAIVVIFGMGVLGDYVWQMLNLQIPENRTWVVGLMQSTQEALVVKNIGYNLAVGTLMFLPYLLLFAFSSRYFITGLTTGSLKE